MSVRGAATIVGAFAYYSDFEVVLWSTFLLGVAMAEDELRFVDDTLPVDDVSSGDIDLVGRDGLALVAAEIVHDDHVAWL